MNKEEKFAAIRRKTRQRLLFALVTMVLYFSFVLNYTSAGSVFLGAPGSGGMPGPVVMFMGLIVSFILLELLFLYLNREGRAK